MRKSWGCPPQNGPKQAHWPQKIKGKRSRSGGSMEGTPPALHAGAAPANLFPSKHQPNRSPQRSQQRGWWLPFSGTPLTSKPSPCSCYSTFSTVLTAPCSTLLRPLLVPRTGQVPALVIYSAPDIRHHTPTPRTTQVSCGRDNGRKNDQRHSRSRPKNNHQECHSAHTYKQALSPQEKVVSTCGQIKKASQHSTGSQVRYHHAGAQRQCPSKDLGRAIYVLKQK